MVEQRNNTSRSCCCCGSDCRASTHARVVSCMRVHPGFARSAASRSRGHDSVLGRGALGPTRLSSESYLPRTVSLAGTATIFTTLTTTMIRNSARNASSDSWSATQLRQNPSVKAVAGSQIACTTIRLLYTAMQATIPARRAPRRPAPRPPRLEPLPPPRIRIGLGAGDAPRTAAAAAATPAVAPGCAARGGTAAATPRPQPRQHRRRGTWSRGRSSPDALAAPLRQPPPAPVPGAVLIRARRAATGSLAAVAVARRRPPRGRPWHHSCSCSGTCDTSCRRGGTRGC
jgi:hypothetical protein